MKSNMLYLLLAVPLAAQNFEIGLNVSKQGYSSYTIYGLGINSNVGTTYAYNSTTAVSARIGYELINMGPATFQVTAAYQPKVDAELKPNGTYNFTKRSTEYLAFGGMFNFKAVVSLSTGLDARSEKMTISGFSPQTTSLSYVRPWARLNVGHVFPSPLVKPFVFFEVAAPLIQKNDAVNLQVGIYAGVRF